LTRGRLNACHPEKQIFKIGIAYRDCSLFVKPPDTGSSGGAIAPSNAGTLSAGAHEDRVALTIPPAAEQFRWVDAKCIEYCNNITEELKRRSKAKTRKMVKIVLTDSAIEDLNVIGESLVKLPEPKPEKKKIL
jgi:hypothetical protein